MAETDSPFDLSGLTTAQLQAIAADALSLIPGPHAPPASPPLAPPPLPLPPRPIDPGLSAGERAAIIVSSIFPILVLLACYLRRHRRRVTLSRRASIAGVQLKEGNSELRHSQEGGDVEGGANGDGDLMRQKLRRQISATQLHLCACAGRDGELGNAAGAASSLFGASEIDMAVLEEAELAEHDHNAYTDVVSAVGSPDAALLAAVSRPNTSASLVQFLLQRGASPDATFLECGALALAARSCAPAVTEALLRAGATVDCKDPRGWTPLMHAIDAHAPDRPRVDVLNLLLDNGAAVDVWGNDLMGPLDLMTQKTRMLEALREQDMIANEAPDPRLDVYEDSTYKELELMMQKSGTHSTLGEQLGQVNSPTIGACACALKERFSFERLLSPIASAAATPSSALAAASVVDVVDTVPPFALPSIASQGSPGHGPREAQQRI